MNGRQLVPAKRERGAFAPTLACAILVSKE